MVVKTITFDTDISVTQDQAYVLECYVYLPDTTQNQLDKSELSFMSISPTVDGAGSSVANSNQILFNSASPFNTWVKITNTITPLGGNGVMSPKIQVVLDNADTSLTFFIDSFSIKTDDTRDLPYANDNNTPTADNEITKIESKVIDRLLQASGKEKITVPIKGYLEENSIFKFGQKRYIVGSQNIDEYTDVNQVQLLEL